LKWYDERLQWNPQNNKNITSVMIDHTKIYIPNIKEDEFTDTDYSSNYDKTNLVEVSYNGQAKHRWLVKFNLPFDYNINHYPYDKHNITIKLKSYGPLYGFGGQYNFSLMRKVLSQKKAVLPSEYELIEATMET